MGSVPWSTRSVDRNHACQRPSHYVFVDTETSWKERPDGEGKSPHTFRLGVAVSVDWVKGRDRQEEWLQFTHVKAFWDWLRTKQHEKRSLWVVGHNMAFDFTILRGWDRLETKEYRVKTEAKEYRDPLTGKARQGKEWQGLCAIDGYPFHIATQGTVGRVNFSDLMNYYKCSLADVGRTVRLDKYVRPPQDASNEWWFAYCRRDVEILKSAYLSLVDLWQREDCGNWSLSGPGLSWNHYRHRHMTTPVVSHAHAEARALEWKAYHPGECRAWFRGRPPGPVVHYDVNSLYPAMMARHDFPFELIDYILCPKPGMVDWLLNRYLCIGEVDVDTAYDDIPYRQAGRTLYPVGRFTTALAGPEFTRAWVGGAVRSVRRLAIYRGSRLFDSFVRHWWDRKRASLHRCDPAGEKFAKLVLNSLPGKFAQRNPSWRFDERVQVVRPWRAFPWKHPETGVVYNARGLGWMGQYAAERTDAKHCFPAIGAFVTSYAREFMRKLRSQVPPSCLYYQDTDSLMMRADWSEGPTEFTEQIGNGLGQLRVIGAYKDVTIRGPKNYTCDGEHTIAGVRVSDDECGPMMWTGLRFEGPSQIVCREPDGTVNTWRVNFDTPGTCLEGGYGDDGWYFPIQIG